MACVGSLATSTLRPSFAVLMMLAAGVAGCIESPAVSSDGPAQPGTPTMSIAVLHRALVDEESFQGEPQVARAPDGALYTYTRLGVLRSDDGGRTWTDPLPPVAGIGIDQTLHVSPEGTVWYAAMAYFYAGQAAARSDDRGETWTSHPAAMHAPFLDRPYIVGTGDDTAHIAYHATHGRVADHVVTTRDGGLTWTESHAAGHDLQPTLPRGRSFWFGDGLLGPDGKVGFPATWFMNGTEEDVCESQNCYRDWAPAALVSDDDDGASWTWWVGPQGEGEPVGVQLVRGVFARDGTLLLTWASVVDGDGAIWLSSTQDGDDWRGPLRIDDGHGAAVVPNVAAINGSLAISYYEADEAGSSDALSDDAAWNVTLVILDEATWDEQARASVNDGPVRHGSMCVQGASCTQDREFLDFFDMVAMPEGVGLVYNTLPRGGDGNLDLQNWFAVAEATTS